MLVNPIPLPYRLLAMALLVVASFLAGGVLGVNWQQGRDAIHEKDVLVKRIETTKTVIKQDNTALAAAQERNRQLQEDNDRLAREAEEHAKTIPDPSACWLDGKRVRTIRRAWGVDVDGNSAGGAPGLRGPEGGSVPGDGKPQRDRGVGNTVGTQVPGVPSR